MPYTQITKLPDHVRNVLPPPGRFLYLAAFNSAWHLYKGPMVRADNKYLDAISHWAAWQAVAQVYEKSEDDGKWHPKD